MFFASDNWAGAHPSISERLFQESGRFAAAYGTSDADRAVEEAFCDLFQKEVAVFFVATGTAANSLALASTARPGGVAFCHNEAHVTADECGAPEFLSGGLRLVNVNGAHGKIDPADLRAKIGRYPPGAVHQGQPVAITITQASEIGTVYTLEEIDAIADVAREHRLPLHMDGARFANALVTLDASAADMTWKRGVDILSFGGTKNGCWCAEALVFFDPEKARELPFLRKRSAQLFSKSRFIAAQFDAYLKGGLWLELARHANAMADDLRAGLSASGRARLAWDTQSNEVFAIVKTDAAKAAEGKGAKFYEWPVPVETPGLLDENETLIRLVTSFATEKQDVASLLDCLA